jgi:hypothetical protein
LRSSKGKRKRSAGIQGSQQAINLPRRQSDPRLRLPNSLQSQARKESLIAQLASLNDDCDAEEENIDDEATTVSSTPNKLAGFLEHPIALPPSSDTPESESKEQRRRLLTDFRSKRKQAEEQQLLQALAILDSLQSDEESSVDGDEDCDEASDDISKAESTISAPSPARSSHISGVSDSSAPMLCLTTSDVPSRLDSSSDELRSRHNSSLSLFKPSIDIVVPKPDINHTDNSIVIAPQSHAVDPNHVGITTSSMEVDQDRERRKKALAEARQSRKTQEESLLLKALEILDNLSLTEDDANHTEQRPGNDNSSMSPASVLATCATSPAVPPRVDPLSLAVSHVTASLRIKLERRKSSSTVAVPAINPPVETSTVPTTPNLEDPSPKPAEIKSRAQLLGESRLKRKQSEERKLLAALAILDSLCVE